LFLDKGKKTFIKTQRSYFVPSTLWYTSRTTNCTKNTRQQVLEIPGLASERYASWKQQQEYWRWGKGILLSVRVVTAGNAWPTNLLIL